MRTIELGNGKVKITPCFVSEKDRRQALLFEPVTESHPIGMLTGDPDGPFIPEAKDTLIILGSLDSAKVLLHQLTECVAEMTNACEAQPE